VVESSWDAITVEDLDGTILDWNQGATRLFGHRREEAVGQSIHLVIPPELREELTGVKEAVRRGGALADLETLRLTKDGRRIPVRLSLSPVREESGEVVALSAIVRDISQELAAARQQQEMTARLESKVAARTRQVRLLQDLATIANESDLLRDALAQAQERLALDHGWVLGHAYRLEEGRLVAAEPWYFGIDRDWSDLVAALEERPLEPGEGLAGAVLAAVEPAATPDLEWLSERARQAAHRAGLTAAVATPIVAGGDVVAVLEFFSQQEIPWRAGLLDELTAAGVQLGRVAERAEMERVVAAAGLAEQRRIGEMLHDTCGQGLAGLMMSAQSLKSRLEEAGAEEAGAMRTLLDDLRQLHQDTRLVARGLVPVEVDGQGLERALERMVEETCEHYPLSCRMVTEGGPVTLDDPFNATHLFYVAQEAVVNAARHSGASEIVVTLRSEGHGVAVEVRDDGRGFSPSEAVGLGLNIMRHRARLIGAELVVDSSPGRGTRVLCTLTG